MEMHKMKLVVFQTKPFQTATNRLFSLDLQGLWVSNLLPKIIFTSLIIKMG